MGRCLSDIAAMAGTPTAALVTIALPSSFSPEWVERLYRGAARLASRCQVAIVGGETTRTPDKTLVSVSVLGLVDKSHLIRRGGARIGDALFVTGELGGSRAGHHLDFEPRLVEARWLAEHFPIHAMMDLSDGIAGDLPHILAASGGPGAELLASAIPIRREARIAARSGSLAKPAMLAALTDGEDFELLMAVPSTHAVALLDAWKSTFPTTRLTCIGKVTREPGLRLREKDGVRRLSAHGYDHFQGPR
jgi:thiamine-monophosphate kinase